MMRFKPIVLMIALAVSAQAQEPRAPEHRNRAQESVTNDDGGEAFLVTRESVSSWSDFARGGAAIEEPQQYSIFLGRGWSKPALQARQPELANLLSSIPEQSLSSAIADSGIKNFFGPTLQRQQLDQPAGVVTDLDVQKLLAEMIRDKTLPQPDSATIYVFFLDPELRSTVGSMTGGKHYVAYHNFFNANRTRLHYVVVPYEADKKRAYEIALRAFVAASLNSKHSMTN